MRKSLSQSRVAAHFCALLCALTVVGGASVLSPVQPSQAASNVHLIIHYWRSDGQYTAAGACNFTDSPNISTCGWNLWIWDFSGNGNGAGYGFTGADSAYNGVVFDMSVPCTTCTTMGFIVRHSIPTNEWDSKDTATDRHLPITNGVGEVWVVAGDPTPYYSLQAAINARAPRIDAAFLDGPKSITLGMSTDYALDGGTDNFQVHDLSTKKNLAVSQTIDGNNFPSTKVIVAGDFQSQLGTTNWNPNSSKTRMKHISGDLYAFTANLNAGNYTYRIAIGGALAFPATNVSLVLGGKEQVTFWYVPYENQVYDSINNPTVSLPPDGGGFKTDLLTVNLKSPANVKDTLRVSGSKLAGVTVIPRNVLNGSQYYYSGALGASYNKTATTFDVWAPTATRVVLQLFNSEAGSLTKSVNMKAVKGGAWQATVKGNLQNWYYLYAVTIGGATSTGVDPYAHGLAVNGTRAMVVNLPATDPKGWSSDKHVTVPNPVDGSIYEADVRDFSIDANSGVSAPFRGKYLAFTQTNTKGPGGMTSGMASVKALGVKEVELMPTYEFNSVDDTNNTQQNWGYDPRNYNVPEGQYATNPHGSARITQYKEMVQSIHKSGMGMIFDGVYSHVYDATVFNPFVSEYYLRTDDFGNYINGTGAGPDVAIERPMVERFVEDSMKYWVQEYHVDGFRLDWMSIFGRTALKKISADLHKILPGIIIVGEPWLSSGDATTVGGVPQSQQVNEGTQQGLGVGVWNDHFRNAICCAAFDTNPSYATGNPHNMAAAGNNLPNTRDAMIGVESGVAGSTHYSSSVYDFAAAPSETLNYATSHDGYTLWDRIKDFSDKTATTADQVSMDELAQAIVFTSQGVPMVLSGEEFLRTKQDSANSFNTGDAANEIDWSLKSKNASVFAYYAGLIHLRAAHPAFRMTTAAQIKANLTFMNHDPVIQYELNGAAVHDSWSKIMVVYNPTNASVSASLPSGEWDVVATNGVAGNSTLSMATGSVQVPAYTAEVLHS